MTKTKLLIKGLLSATALTAISTGTAFAAGTTAGKIVSNTFTLDYNVGTTPQTQITGTAPTTFVVDRLIDVNVAPNAVTTVAPGAQNELLNYTLTNEGNDTQAYVLTAANVATGDDFGTANISILYYVDDGDGVFEPGGDDGAPITYNGTSTSDVPADGILFVQIESDMAAIVDNGDEADMTLLAETAVTGGAGTLETEDGDGNDIDAAENVFADASGVLTDDTVTDGSHSALNTYIVLAADLDAVKAVSVYAQTPSAANDCAVIPGVPATPVAEQYAVPGSCVEYTITATNSGAATATGIVIDDTLPPELIFIAASDSGFSTAGSFSTLPSANQDCAATPCQVVYDTAQLTDGSTTPTVGVVTIRALVK